MVSNNRQLHHICSCLSYLIGSIQSILSNHNSIAKDEVDRAKEHYIALSSELSTVSRSLLKGNYDIEEGKTEDKSTDKFAIIVIDDHINKWKKALALNKSEDNMWCVVNCRASLRALEEVREHIQHPFDYNKEFGDVKDG